MSRRSLIIFKISLSAMLLALAWILPFLTGQIPEFGIMLQPMHLPAMLAGFLLGPYIGLGLGIIMPLTRCLFFSTPVFYPTALCMAFELGAYAFVSGMLFRLFSKKIKVNSIINIYLSLIIAQIAGRIVWGISRFLCGLFVQNPFTFQLFIQGAFWMAWPGIILQLILIPILIKVLDSTGILKKLKIIDNP